MTAKNKQPQPPRSLIECFEEIEDPRIDRTRVHKLIDILVIGLCTMLTVGENFTDMEDFGKAKRDWLKTFVELPHGIPSHDTFNRVFSAIDPKHFPECFIAWVKSICPTLGPDVVAIATARRCVAPITKARAYPTSSAPGPVLVQREMEFCRFLLVSIPNGIDCLVHLQISCSLRRPVSP
jgi:hypothetical protein